METIDLSKAKIGDKFRTRDGQILEYIGENFECRNDRYELIDEQGLIKYFYQYGNYLICEENALDLIVKAPNKPLDELIEEATKEIKENCDAIAEENELQRRQEVVELAEKLWLRNLKDLAEYSYFDAFKDAETFIKLKVNYLKEGKLC
jgi:hypothetical protein